MHVTPGQLFAWDFKVADGWWILTRVKEDSDDVFGLDVMTITRGEVLLIVSTGTVRGSSSDCPGFTTFDLADKRMNHIAVLRNTLVWVNDDELECCRPLSA